MTGGEHPQAEELTEAGARGILLAGRQVARPCRLAVWQVEGRDMRMGGVERTPHVMWSQRRSSLLPSPAVMQGGNDSGGATQAHEGLRL
jgi:hypothetical protein